MVVRVVEFGLKMAAAKRVPKLRRGCCDLRKFRCALRVDRARIISLTSQIILDNMLDCFFVCGARSRAMAVCFAS